MAGATKPEHRQWAAATLLSVLEACRPDCVTVTSHLGRIHDALIRLVLTDSVDLTADLALQAFARVHQLAPKEVAPQLLSALLTCLQSPAATA